MPQRVTVFAFVLLSVASASAQSRQVTPISEEVRERYALDPFYTQIVEADGLIFVASGGVPAEGLLEAAYLIDHVLAGRDDLREAIAGAQIRLVVMNHDEFTTDVPEHSQLDPKDWWDKRARGLGANGRRSAMSCGVENLLQYQGDPYSDENILIHEFAHVIHTEGLRAVDPGFDQKLRTIYSQAMDEGLWKDTYAATNPAEYWAELVQVWFFCNPPRARSVHNDINTRAELAEYDPRAFELLTEVFGGNDYQYRFPKDREDRAHLTDWDFDAAPRFEWPERLRDIDLSQRPRRGGDD